MSGRNTVVLAGLLMGALVSPAAGQSLGDVARQEAARREKVKGGKVLTNADLPASAILVPQDTAPPAGEEPGTTPLAAAAAAAAGPGAAAEPGAPAAAQAGTAKASDAATGSAAAAPTDDEPGWRARAERINSELSAARAQVRQLKALSDRLSLEAQASNPAIAARAADEREALRAQIAQAEAKEAAAAANRQALERDARIAGVPPTWIQ